eukprot:TRINITY_DN1639_c0_g1_i1.p1 TRINITY_DN1639_c0_g1~~TRINITY_DN1639_c0_g1_i1.p1  ORF type:complete len:460 (-),score=121.58 TRINITY_DN1639_c0_g1_i1:79-1458(-)
MHNNGVAAINNPTAGYALTPAVLDSTPPADRHRRRTAVERRIYHTIRLPELAALRVPHQSKCLKTKLLEGLEEIDTPRNRRHLTRGRTLRQLCKTVALATVAFRPYKGIYTDDEVDAATYKLGDATGPGDRAVRPVEVDEFKVDTLKHGRKRRRNVKLRLSSNMASTVTFPFATIARRPSRADLDRVSESLAPLQRLREMPIPRRSRRRKSAAVEKVDAVLDVLSGDDGVHAGVSLVAVRHVLEYMDADKSGEIDPNEFKRALAAARCGRFPHDDPALGRCLQQIEGHMRLQHLRAQDVFKLLDADRGGTISIGELEDGLTCLCATSVEELAAAKSVLQQAAAARRKEKARKRDALLNFLTSLDSVLPEMMQDRVYFGSEADDEKFLESISHDTDSEGPAPQAATEHRRVTHRAAQLQVEDVDPSASVTVPASSAQAQLVSRLRRQLQESSSFGGDDVT